MCMMLCLLFRREAFFLTLGFLTVGLNDGGSFKKTKIWQRIFVVYLVSGTSYLPYWTLVNRELIGGGGGGPFSNNKNKQPKKGRRG